MPRILHITCDYPDQIDANKTHAVKNLIEHARGLEHQVISLNRTARPGHERVLEEINGVRTISFAGLPYGVLLRSSMLRLARQLEPIVAATAPDLIHCHKLTFEGIAGYRLSRRLEVPLACTIRGDTDLKVIRFKPGYQTLFREIIDHSQQVFFVAPWTRDKIENWYEGSLAHKAIVLPNIVEMSFDRKTPFATISRTFVTVCHLKDYPRKNLARVIRAVDRCVGQGHDIRLDIIGGGPAEMVARAKRDIGHARHPDRFRLLGHVERSELTGLLQDYAGLVLPSFPETFGMVYLEALQGGIPFLHSRDAGVDGYFSTAGVSVAVDPRSVDSIQAGVLELLAHQHTYKNNIRLLAESGGLERFDAARIALQYEDAVRQVL